MDDLKILWNDGVEMYDTYRREVFTLKVVLLWTINDFLAYGNMCSCTVKCYFACSICGEGTSSKSLKHSRNMSFTSHKRFLQ